MSQPGETATSGTVSRVKPESRDDGASRNNPPKDERKRIHREQLGKSNVVGFYRGAPYRTNAKGLTGLPKRPHQDVTLALIGGGSAMGTGVLPREGLAETLSLLLNAVHHHKAHWIANLALDGLRVRGAVRRWAERGQSIPAKLVVYVWRADDILDESPANDDLAAASETQALWSDEQATHAEALASQYRGTTAAWRGFHAALARLAELAKKRGQCAAVFLQPAIVASEGRALYTAPYERVAEAASALGIHVIRDDDAFAGFDPRDLRLDPDGLYPNAIAHRMLARVALDGLRALPPHCSPASASATPRSE